MYLLVKIRKAALLVFFLTASHLHAQNSNVWIFGYRAGIDFNSATPVPIISNLNMNPGTGNNSMFAEASASVCDDNGRLLFYTNGTHVWNRNHDTMPNGSKINPVNVLNNAAEISSTQSSNQGTLVIPVPGMPDRYFIFSLLADEAITSNILPDYPQYTNRKGWLYYSVVDMSLNGGLGDVMVSQKGILVDSLLTEAMVAVRGEDCGFWLITHTANLRPNRIKAYEVTTTGIGRVVLSSEIDCTHYGGVNISIVAHLSASHSGKKLALACSGLLGGGGCRLFDFDLVTGMTTNALKLDSRGSYSVSFSPNESKLYTSTENSLYQYDLSSGILLNIISSRASLLNIGTITHIKLAPDNKMYFNRSRSVLGAIENPDMRWPLCTIIPDAIQLLPLSHSWCGLPANVLSRWKPQDTTFTANRIYPECYAQQVVISATDTAGLNYTWNDGDTGIFRTINKDGTYWVTYILPSCRLHTDTFHVRIVPFPEIVTEMSCKGDSNGRIAVINAPGDSTLFTYTWYNTGDNILRGPLQSNYGDTLISVPAGNYWLKVRNPEGCDTLLQIKVPERDYQAGFTVSDTLICMGDTLSFQNTSFGLDTYQWLFGDGDSSYLVNPRHVFVSPGNYLVQLRGQSRAPACYDTAYQIIVVDTLLNNTFVADRYSICTGEAIAFYPQANDSTLISLHWNLGDSLWLESGFENIQHAYDKSGLMVVTLTSRFRACPDIQYSDTIRVYPLPKIDLGPDSLLCLSKAPVFLSNLASNESGYYNYLWNTGDTTPILKVFHQGTYSLQLTNRQNCTAKETIEIHKGCYIDIPNVFTPNGDGVNDYFFPRQLLSGNVQSFRMQIFNRWGAVLFTTSQIDGRGWDGKFNGRDQPVGVYVYLLDVIFDNRRKEQYEGNVTLIR